MSRKQQPNHWELSSDQALWCLQHNENVANMIEDVADKGAVPNGAFVFFAAFDGTNNDKTDLDEWSTTPYSTNVGQLWDQYEEKQKTDPRLHGKYYCGLGTRGKPWTETWSSTAVTRGVVKTAEDAYADFTEAASGWLKVRKNRGTVTVVVTGFSRGGASAAIFSQLLYKNGLVDGSRKVLRKPGKVCVPAAVLFDPVATGVDRNLAFPPNVKSVVCIKALNEFRTMFRAVDYSKQRPTVKTFGMYGNHCDIGGGYDHGLAAVSLEAATRFLQKSGLALSDVPYERQLIPDQRKYRGTGKKRRGADRICIHREEAEKDDSQLWSVDQPWLNFETNLRLWDTDVVIKPFQPGKTRKKKNRK
jgi:hypothetical protein